MPLPGVKFATLTDEQIAELQALEKEFGIYLLALAPERLRLAPLTPDQLKRIEEVEENLGVMLVAYQPRQ